MPVLEEAYEEGFQDCLGDGQELEDGLLKGAHGKSQQTHNELRQIAAGSKGNEPDKALTEEVVSLRNDADRFYIGGHQEDELETLSELSEAPTDLQRDIPESMGGTSTSSCPTGTRRTGLLGALPYPLVRLANLVRKDDSSTVGVGNMQTRLEATLNLLNNLMGAGLLAMPCAFSNAGLISGLILMGLVAIANRYTMLKVLWMTEALLGGGEASYPELGRRVFGQPGLIAVLVAILFYTGGILVAYLIALADIFRQLGHFAGLPRCVHVALAVLMCLPGASLRSLRGVAQVSAICMAGVCMLVVTMTYVCISDSLSPSLVNAPIEDRGRPGDVDLFRGDLKRVLAGASLFALQFSVQAGGVEVLSQISPGIAPIGEEEAPQHQQAHSSLKVATEVSKVSFMIAWGVSAALGSAAYIRFGDHVAGDVLLDFSLTASYIPLMVTWVAYGFVVICSFAFIIVPCRLAALDVFALRRRDHAGSSDSMSQDRFRQMNFIIIGTSAVVAWLVTDLATILEFIGVWATMALAFIFPCSFLIEVRRQEGLPILSVANVLPLLLIAFGVTIIWASSAEYFISFIDFCSTNLFRSEQKKQIQGLLQNSLATAPTGISQ
eukprot:TRINITY_DN79791_c0_g1_i1.p1 TRINITY_DN79791_c0_g1~~TRINITY_DN79791_c0_g1_i1.p1  ORF type:complete len:608 (+),score=80.44 TRINITY_DN79791_c0_g1_i1:127-1950(+)